MLKEMLCKAVPSLEVREQQFTDIAISYLDGLYVEILGVLLVDNLAPFLTVTLCGWILLLIVFVKKHSIKTVL